MFEELHGYECGNGQTLKLTLPENYKSSNEAKRREMNKL